MRRMFFLNYNLLAVGVPEKQTNIFKRNIYMNDREINIK